MSQSFTRRIFLGTAAAAMVAASAWAESPTTSLRPMGRDDDLYKQAIPNVSEIIADSGISGTVAFAVVDVESGIWLEASNATDGIPPASSIKAITALYALDQLGPDHVFETRLLATGGVVNGEVQGDLILVGGGDPTLDSDDLGQMAEELKEAGIIGVKGTFKVYEGAFPATFAIDPEQPDHVGYNPGVSGIALNYNRVHFEWKRSGGGYDVTMEGRAGRYAPAVRAATMGVVDRSGPVYTYENKPDRDVWTVAKSALGSGGARWLPIRRPGVYAGDIFATIARSHGIKLGDAELADALPEGETLVTHRSAKLRPILKDMLEYSTNLTAEMVGLAASAKRLGTVPSLRASAAEMNKWAVEELGMESPAMIDHSGLGDDSKMTVHDMAGGLARIHGTGLRPILKPVYLRDDRGRPERNNPIKIDAKTGTLNFVSALAGFLTTPEDRVLAFAILTANTDERAKISRAERERPPGARTWNGRAKRVQRGLLERWGLLYNVAVKPEPEAAAEPETQTAPEPDAEGDAEQEAVLEES
ncbi:D-alanyl-D-alanine carboxypeptidase/D-alanyl-D-alanine-endopeptidase [Sulfitobacter sp. W002]|uniref:D-alanyl-D-alanine carboxypeptidase/D-alanyl-D-alanine endopeptidase n=1 Tax=Sulfitobacter sp. W002 TaxID=2867024 RepID=UPI0021A816E4|nr:D-alanyl-D-alanine carboxypeptidase/D-alanyl-D-alanine-endopeptidase [Sulfitobacter sp. W002]